MDIVAFLTARLDERQAAAEAAQASDPAPWRANTSDGAPTNQRSGHGAGLVIAADDKALWDCEGSNTLCMTAATAAHVALNDPAWVLADVAAKRAIIERHTSGVIRAYQCSNRDHIQDWQCERSDEPHEETRYCEICDSRDGCAELQELAAIHADHPDYDEAWRIDA